MDDCIFCKIIRGEIPCYKIYEDDETLAFLDIADDCVGHTLVIPKKHVKNIFDCDEKTFLAVMKTVKKVADHYKTCGIEGVNIMNANEECAQQSVFHLHYHILPRTSEDKINAWPELSKKFQNFEQVQKKLKF